MTEFIFYPEVYFEGAGGFMSFNAPNVDTICYCIGLLRSIDFLVSLLSELSFGSSRLLEATVD